MDQVGGKAVLFKCTSTRGLRSDQFPIGGIIGVPLIHFVPCYNAPILHISSSEHNRCNSVDAREEGKETPLQEHFGAESQCTNGVWAVAGVVKSTGRKLVRARHSKNYDEGFVCVANYVVILASNLNFAIDWMRDE